MPRIVSVAAVLLLASTSVALAHAHLQSAIPPVDGVVATAPLEVVITYSEAVEPRFSTVMVRDASGQRVDAGAVHTAPADAKRLVVPLKALTPGTYRVEWHVTSVDTHKTEGSFAFTVKP